MFGIGLSELLVILLIVLVIFGARRLPEIGAGLGQGIRNFKKAFKEDEAIDVTPEDKLEDKSTKDKDLKRSVEFKEKEKAK